MPCYSSVASAAAASGVASGSGSAAPRSSFRTGYAETVPMAVSMSSTALEMPMRSAS